MNELIKITKQNGKQVVSARELHNFLESKQDFSTWMKNRIEKYGLIEKVDFEVFHNFMENPKGGRPLTEYALSVDAAKELSMVEGNEKGKQARRYFIEVEKSYRNLSTQPSEIPQSFSEALMLAAKQAAEIEKKELQLKLQAPKVLFADAVATSERSILIGELAKIMHQNGVSIGQNRLFEELRRTGYLGNKGEYYNTPTQRAIEQGLFEIKKTSITKPDGTVLVTTTTKVTGKGQIYFLNKFIKSIK